LSFDDQRLPEILFRYRARNFPQCLNDTEQQLWREFCSQRLSDPRWGAPITLPAFEQALSEKLLGATAEQAALLQQWAVYAQGLRARYNLDS
jgi:exodeoxyribonuclease-1